MSGTGVFSQLLQINYGIKNVSTTQTFPNYILFLLTFGVSLACRGDIDKVIREHWWKYMLIAVLDVETNYLYVLAYKYTTIASAQVCMCTVPRAYVCVMVPLCVAVWVLQSHVCYVLTLGPILISVHYSGQVMGK